MLLTAFVPFLGDQQQKTGWWQLKYFWNFHPDMWGNDSIWRAYFSNGWFNHQLEKNSTKISKKKIVTKQPCRMCTMQWHTYRIPMDNWIEKAMSPSSTLWKLKSCWIRCTLLCPLVTLFTQKMRQDFVGFFKHLLEWIIICWFFSWLIWGYHTSMFFLPVLANMYR